VITLSKLDLMVEYPLMAEWYLLSSLSTFEAAAPALLVRSPAKLVIREFRPEASVGIPEMAVLILEPIEEGAPVIRLASELISPTLLVTSPASELTRVSTLVRL